MRIGEVVLDTNATATGAVTLGIRPEHFRFGDAGLEGRIDQIEPMGRETLYVVETPLGAIRVLDPARGTSHSIGASVRVEFTAEDTLLFDGSKERLMQDNHVHLDGAG